MTYRSIRWVVATLLFLATTINYIDRQTLSVLSGLLRRELHLSDRDYANIVTAFLAPYTIMYSLGGRIIDRIGVRLGAALSLGWWSVATMLTAAAHNAFSLAACRFLLGIGEPAIFPAGVRACGEWFPPKERALPTGFFSAGSAVGALIAAPLIVLLTLHFGWRLAFLIPGSIGILWLPFWLWAYHPPERHPVVTPSDLQHLRAAEKQEPRPSWASLLRRREVWGLVLPRLASDPVWYFYLFWLPDYLQRERHLNLAEIAAYGWIPFLFADIGGIGGGALSDWLVRRGIAAKRARLLVLAAVGCLAPFGALVGLVDSVALAIALTCLATLLSQCWASNIATLAADVSPAGSTATVVGMMGTAGSLAGAVFSQILGFVIGAFGYPAAFMLAGALHPIAAVTVNLMLRDRK